MHTWEESMEEENWLDGIDVGVFMGPDKQDTQAVVAEQLKAANSVPAKLVMKPCVTRQVTSGIAEYSQSGSVVTEWPTTENFTESIPVENFNKKRSSTSAKCHTPGTEINKHLGDMKTHRMSAVFLGVGKDQVLLDQPASPHATPVKRLFFNKSWR